MKADQLMTRTVGTCSSADSLERAANLMWEHDLGCLVVIDAEERPVGMITDRDVAMAAYTQGVRLCDTSVATAMAREVVSCGAEASAADVERLMQSAQIRRVPVVGADGKLVGIVALGDLARAAHSSALHVTAIPGVAKTLATVTTRRQPAPAAAAE